MNIRLLAGIVFAALVAVPVLDAWSGCTPEIFRCDQCLFSGKFAKECSADPNSSSAEFKFDSVQSFSCQLEGGNGCTGQVACAGTDACEKVALFVDGICSGAYMAQQQTVCCDACSF